MFKSRYKPCPNRRVQRLMYKMHIKSRMTQQSPQVYAGEVEGDASNVHRIGWISAVAIAT